MEVIKGPQSTLYGTQALGGVVNILTKDPANTPTVSADVYGKSTREGSITLAASPEIGRFKGFVSGNALRMENYVDENDDGFSDQAKRSRLALFGKGTLTGTNGEKRLNVAAKLYAEDRTGGHTPIPTVVGTLPPHTIWAHPMVDGREPPLSDRSLYS